MNLHSHPELQRTRKPVNARTGRGVTAVLGPTNTGKTHLAIERMLAHPTGMIGLPLRLLAREVYQRVADKAGLHQVALLTGEEKIVPPSARYFVCTVEAMPSQADVDFLAIDEVQLATSLDRGHFFTDRIIHERGNHETLLLGAATMQAPLESLLPGINVVSRPRMSQLFYAGQKKITRLPRRSAIVAFSADEVYAIAELIRRQRGAAAVVLGSLSPRTRNAQVALYQSGDVDFLVATDAIGMGLNLDVDHVAFAQEQKFDGYAHRRLKPAEFAQIAGRAGRHVKDGTFGVTGQVNPFEDELVERLESHEFPQEKLLQWRHRDLDFSSIESLVRGLEMPPNHQSLVKAPMAVDQRALTTMNASDDIRQRARSNQEIELLWQVAQIPDYRKIAPANHADLLATIFRDLIDDGQVNEDWFAEQVAQTDNCSGEIDALSNRIAHIRTWTYLSNRAGWLEDTVHWQNETRKIEDRLSDALHERLTKRFVDRRTSVLMKRLRENKMLEAEIAANGEVTVEGHHVGELLGFRFTADATDGPDAKAATAAAQKALAGEYDARATRLHAAPNSDIVLESDGTLRWIGAPVGRLAASEDVLKPRVLLLADDQLSGASREKVTNRLNRWISFHIETLLKPLLELKDGHGLEGIASGIAFQIVENLGSVDRRTVARDMRELSQEQRASLRTKGVRFGAYHIFVPILLKPAPAELISLLWALKSEKMEADGRSELVAALASGRTSLPKNEDFEQSFYRLCGFRLLGKKAVRVDILERLADFIRPAVNWKFSTEKKDQRPDGAFDGWGFMITTPMLSILGATHDDMADVLRGLGYKAETLPEAEILEKIKGWDEAGQPPAENVEASPPQPTNETAAEDNGEEKGGAAAEAPAQADEQTAQAEPANQPRDEQIAVSVLTDDDGGEEKRILVWRQVRDAPAKRHRRPQNKNEGPNRKHSNSPRGQKNFRGKGGQRGGSKPAERQPDPDSPFAALQALKDGLGKGGKGS